MAVLLKTSYPNRGIPMTAQEVDSLFQQGLSYHQHGDIVNAVLCYQQVLTIEPCHASTRHGLGVIHLQQGMYQDACRHFEKALAICSTKAVYWSNYGASLLKLERKNDAKTALEKALFLCKDYPDAMYNLGVVSFELQEYDRAEILLAGLLDRCDYPQAIPLLIEVLCAKKAYEKAFQIYAQFRNSQRISPEMMDKIASVFHKSKQYDFMTEITEDVVRADGEKPRRSLFLAWGHAEKELLSMAKYHFLKAAAHYPDRPLWKHKYLGLCPTVFASNKEIDGYWRELHQSLESALENPSVMNLNHAFEDGVMPSFNLPHLMFCCREVKEKFARLIRPSFRECHPPKLQKTDKIRIAFFVFSGHQGGCMRSDAGLMKRLNRQHFELIFITGKDVLDYCKSEIRSDNVEYIGISSNFEEAVQQIRDTKCHILYHWQTCSDLMNYLIPFARCAPIQITGFGMHGTTGTSEVDYFMSSKYLEPACGDGHYTEKLICCNEIPTWQTRIDRKKFKAVRSDFGLPESGAIYFCPHRLPKFHPDFDLFLRDILEKDHHGHIVVLAHRNKYAVEKLRKRWDKTIGHSLASRIITHPSLTPFDYYRLTSVSSCVLDSPCYSTSFTGFDTLALGVPLIGFQGQLMVQRYASAFYKRMKLHEFIPKNRKEYVTLATTVANDTDFRYHFTMMLNERKEVLFENRRVISCFEELLERIFSESTAWR